LPSPALIVSGARAGAFFPAPVPVHHEMAKRSKTLLGQFALMGLEAGYYFAAAALDAGA
jgi:hypothetical protein